jgi:preprotein translocase subunit SecG
LTIHPTKGIIRKLRRQVSHKAISFQEKIISVRRQVVGNVVDISLIVVSVALIASVILQSKGAGLGGLTGADTGGIFTARRGVEKTLFYATIALSVLFFVLAVLSVKLA